VAELRLRVGVRVPREPPEVVPIPRESHSRGVKPPVVHGVHQLVVREVERVVGAVPIGVVDVFVRAEGAVSKFSGDKVARHVLPAAGVGERVKSAADLAKIHAFTTSGVEMDRVAIEIGVRDLARSWGEIVLEG